MKIVCISDTHQFHRGMLYRIPDGDVLVHAGDSTNHGSLKAAADFNEWLGELPHKHKIVIAGNHDFHFQNHLESAKAILTNATYLEDSGIEIEGVKFWGAPWSTEFCDWAFMGNEYRLRSKWAKIPTDTHILITHGPAYGILDKVARRLAPSEGEGVGSHSLRERLRHLKQLRAHICGHIHESYGTFVEEKSGVKFVNASTCDVSYVPVNPPIVIEL